MSRARENRKKMRKQPLAYTEGRCPKCGVVIPKEAMSGDLDYICRMCGTDVFAELRTMLKEQNLM